MIAIRRLARLALAAAPLQAAPAPRLSETAAGLRVNPDAPGCDTTELLTDCGFDRAEAERLALAWNR